MKKLTPKQEAEYVKKVIERNNSMVYNQEARIRAGLAEMKLIKYIKDKYMKPNNLTGDDVDFIELVESGKIKSESDADDYFMKFLKPTKPTKAPKEPNKKIVKEIKKMIKKIPNIKTHDTSDDIFKMIFNVIDTKPPPVRKHDTSDSILKTIFNVLDTKITDENPVDTKKGYEIIEKLEKRLNKPKEKRPLLDSYTFTSKPLIEQLADSIKNYPMLDNINKGKINKYSFEVVDKFNKKYPELMLRLFKDKNTIDKLLTNKSDNVQKKALSEEKEKARKQKYSEKAKEERKTKKKEKVKHLDDLTPEEFLKFQQARNYYMRKSKTSNILPKNLNKEDPEGLNNVCKELAEKGFDTMSEQLFMQIYEG